ncbi:phosphatases II [Fistulina hepatica ATCC 64428]|uniref:Phosphatases II n=1 Tax=Fistulina hepatica ATCC 64428 TaxID=1128425 RepID=A0A0D7AJP9_9AGAR|nr:phosphatases II [Fistulina hepatica ATCC 64428]
MTRCGSPSLQWLIDAQSEDHQDLVLRVLEAREDLRCHARYVSQYHHKLPLLGRLPRGIDSNAVSYYSVSAATTPETIHHNRYVDVLPFDRTRVLASGKSCCSDDGSDVDEGRYLNANWILERFGGKWWIASQAPLPHTAHAFLSLIYDPITLPSPHTSDTSLRHCCRRSALQSRVRTVVQLTQNVEHGRRKAHTYFPGEIGQTEVVSSEQNASSAPLRVTLLDSKTAPSARCVISTVSISSCLEDSGNEAVTFRHLLYTAWPDHGVPLPEDRASLLEFVKLVDSTNRCAEVSGDASRDPDPPVIVGCSAGIGRTGTFIALSSLLRDQGVLPPPAHPTPFSVLQPSPLGELSEDVKWDHVALEVDTLREQRPGMVQRDEQLFSIYALLHDGCLTSR